MQYTLTCVCLCLLATAAAFTLKVDRENMKLECSSHDPREESRYFGLTCFV